MKRRTAMESAAPRTRSTRGDNRCPHSGDGGSESVTSVGSDRDQQRHLESCEPAEEKLRIKKKHRSPPDFLKGLVRAVTDRSDVISFKDGTVTIKNHTVLVTDVLPVFFRASTSLKSFLRQLNYFAFKKIGGKGAKEPGIFVNATLKGKDAGAILSLKRRQPGNLDDKSATRQSPRLPRSASSPELTLKAAALSATVASLACSLPAHKTKLPPPATARSAAASSTSLLLPSKAIDTRSGVDVPTKPEIRGYTTSEPRTIAAGEIDCDMAIGNNWNSFDARCSGHNTSDVMRNDPVPGRDDRTSFTFGFNDGRVAGHVIGTPPSSRRCIFSAVVSRDGSGWRERRITPCPAPTTSVEPPSARSQPGSGLQPEMAMAAAAATRSPRTDRLLPGAYSQLGFSTGPDLFPASEKVRNTTAVVGRGTSMDTTIEGVGGGGEDACSCFGGKIICFFDSAKVFGSFCAVEGDVSLDRLDECFMRERVSSPSGQEGFTDHGNAGREFSVGLCDDYSC